MWLYIFLYFFNKKSQIKIVTEYCNWKKFLFLLWNIPRDCNKFTLYNPEIVHFHGKPRGDALPNYQDLLSLSIPYSFLIQCRRHSRYNLKAHRGETRENYYNNRRRLYRLKPDANFQSGRFPTSRAIVNEIVPRVSVRIRRIARWEERDVTPMKPHH